LAGPDLPWPTTRPGIGLVLVADVSGSMAESDGGPTRIETLKRTFDELIARRPGDRIGLVLFAAHPDTACPPTHDHAAVRAALAAATPRGVPTESETNLGDAVAWALARLTHESGGKAIVVCSDGEHNVPAPALSPRQAGQLAAAAGVPVFTLDAGPPDGAGAPGLTALAQMTGGAVVPVGDVASLDSLLHALPQSRVTDPSAPRTRWPAQLTTGLTLAALAWLVLRRVTPFEDTARLVAGLAAAACFAMAALPTADARPAGSGPDVVIVLDASRSMLARDTVPDRFSRGQSLAGDLLDRLPGSRVGVVAFAGTPQAICPLTADSGAARASLTSIDPESAADLHPDRAVSGTRIGAALRHARQRLAGGRPSRIVLISDGDDPADDGEWRTYPDVTIPVHVLGVGKPEPAPVPGVAGAMTRRVDDTLEAIAATTTGRYFPVDAGSVAIDDLANRIRAGAVVTHPHSAPGFGWLLAGWVLLAGGWAMPTRAAWAPAVATLAVAAIPPGDAILRGNQAQEAGRPADALALYDRAAERTTDPGEAAFNQGVALAHLGRHAEAAERFRRSLTDATGERRNRALYNLGTSRLREPPRRAAVTEAIAVLSDAEREATGDLRDMARANRLLAEQILAILPAIDKEQEPPGDGPPRPGDTAASSANNQKPRPSTDATPKLSPPTGSPDQTTPQTAPGRGNLPMLPDTETLAPITDVARYLAEVELRVRAHRQEQRRVRTVPRREYPDW
ncbi:MAG: VWA domain-containing protein, partial [Gemmataceae bacterium]|nr:VWA domain-containing protein [Gemmataceae bacterium]